MVRTKFIDDLLATLDVPQMVNLGAGVDTRAYRLDAFKRFRASYEVDTAEVSLAKPTVGLRVAAKSQLRALGTR